MSNAKLFKPALPKRSQLIAEKARAAVIELAPEAVAELQRQLADPDAKIRQGAVRLILDRAFPAPRDGASAGDIAAAAAGGAAGAHMAALMAKAANRAAKALETTAEPVPALPKGRNIQSDQ
jgi:hypothetical protein